jgi:hypothetical protein
MHWKNNRKPFADTAKGFSVAMPQNATGKACPSDASCSFRSRKTDFAPASACLTGIPPAVQQFARFSAGELQ